MNDGKVMRSVYLWVEDDNKLRQIAHETRVHKSDLIRAALAIAIPRWEAMDDADVLAEIAAVERARDEGGSFAPAIVPANPAPAPAPVPAAAPASAAKRRADKKPEPRGARSRTAKSEVKPPSEARHALAGNI